jgi:hypothetical protein
MKPANCIEHELEYSLEQENYKETWNCKNCPYSEWRYIECL